MERFAGAYATWWGGFCFRASMPNQYPFPYASTVRENYSRYPDVQHSLGLAASLSPQHALEWLVYSDKVRLLAEVYGTQPKNPEIDDATGLPHVVQVFDKQHMFLQNQYTKAMDDLQSTLQMRVMEVMEASARWVRFTS